MAHAVTVGRLPCHPVSASCVRAERGQSATARRVARGAAEARYGGTALPGESRAPQALSPAVAKRPHQPLPQFMDALWRADTPMLWPPRSPGPIPPQALDRALSQLSKRTSTRYRVPELVDWLFAVGFQCDDRLCATMIRALALAGEHVRAVGIYNRMRLSESRGGLGMRPTVFVYTAAMKAALDGGLLSVALGVWSHAKAAGVRRDAKLTCTYMTVLVRAGRRTQAAQFYYDFIARDGTAPPHAQALVLRALVLDNKAGEARRVWEEECLGQPAGQNGAGSTATAPTRRRPPTRHAYSAAISMYAKLGDAEAAEATFRGLCDSGARPDVVACTALLTAYAQVGDVRGATALLRDMREWGLRPSAHTFSALIAVYAAAQQWPRAVQLLRSMHAPEWTGPRPAAWLHCVLLAHVARLGTCALSEALFSAFMAPSGADASAQLPRCAVPDRLRALVDAPRRCEVDVYGLPLRDGDDAEASGSTDSSAADDWQVDAGVATPRGAIDSAVADSTYGLREAAQSDARSSQSGAEALPAAPAGIAPVARGQQQPQRDSGIAVADVAPAVAHASATAAPTQAVPEGRSNTDDSAQLAHAPADGAGRGAAAAPQSIVVPPHTHPFWQVNQRVKQKASAEAVSATTLARRLRKARKAARKLKEKAIAENPYADPVVASAPRNMFGSAAAQVLRERLDNADAAVLATGPDASQPVSAAGGVLGADQYMPSAAAPPISHPLDAPQTAARSWGATGDAGASGLVDPLGTVDGTAPALPSEALAPEGWPDPQQMSVTGGVPGQTLMGGEYTDAGAAEAQATQYADALQDVGAWQWQDAQALQADQPQQDQAAAAPEWQVEWAEGTDAQAFDAAATAAAWQQVSPEPVGGAAPQGAAAATPAPDDEMLSPRRLPLRSAHVEGVTQAATAWRTPSERAVDDDGGDDDADPDGAWAACRDVLDGAPSAVCQLDEEVLSVEEAAAALRELELSGDGVPRPSLLRSRSNAQHSINEAVMGALALSYVQRNRWREAVAVLGRARALRIAPHARLYNMAMFAAAKAGQHHVVTALLSRLPERERLVGYETLMFAYGRRGLHGEAEDCVAYMLHLGLPIRDYAVVGLIQAYSEAGQWRSALAVQRRVPALGVTASVHVLNALLTVCVRHAQYDRGLRVLRSVQIPGDMKRSPQTGRLVDTLCKREAGVLEMQHALTTAFSAAAAAVGGALIRSGMM